ncbi:hypothetical protein [Magnetospirillum sp. UT-4]|uniref:hypothetical protein n=1 Tax=Magnetospirillum sp. UT-4 TaxID=2681467 RepID=UPI00137F982A|nr:hypothetical protein [Magnetospirillum sp. UT-4]CAA7617615.1 conserved hypothetical protein [Magnetospirillum sp. UT-4]
MSPLRHLPRRALVMFSGRTDLWWLRALKPGFRHCFVALAEGEDSWVVVEPLSHRTLVECVALPPGFDLAAWYRAHGLRVVETTAAEPPRRTAPWRPYSCVESVKRVLGIHAGAVLTPWQLFRHLEQNRKIVVDAADPARV